MEGVHPYHPSHNHLPPRTGLHKVMAGQGILELLMRDGRYDRTIRPGSDIVNHAERIQREYSELLAALRKAGWKDCPPNCSCRGTAK